MELLELIGLVEGVLIDPFFVVDPQRRIVHHNPAFRELVPRTSARRLIGRSYDEIVRYALPGEGGCIVERCWTAGRHLRLDGVEGHVAGSRKRLSLTVGAQPFFEASQQPSGALVVQRDMTHEAQLQHRYRRMLDHAAQQREHLETIVGARTTALLEANTRLIETRRELLELQRALF